MTPIHKIFLLVVVVLFLILRDRKLHGFVLKDGVDVRFLKPSITRVLPNLYAIIHHHTKHIDNFVPRITSGSDGVHMPSSKHYTGEAVDLGIKTKDWAVLPEMIISSIIYDMHKLGIDYDIVYHEGSHIHFEYDPKG